MNRSLPKPPPPPGAAIPADNRQLELLHADKTIITPYGKVTVGPVRWVYPDVARLWLSAPADAWPVTLFDDNGQRSVVFNTPDELLSATLEVQ